MEILANLSEFKTRPRPVQMFGEMLPIFSDPYQMIHDGAGVIFLIKYKKENSVIIIFELIYGLFIIPEVLSGLIDECSNDGLYVSDNSKILNEFKNNINVVEGTHHYILRLREIGEYHIISPAPSIR